ncbi:MAG: MBL fold metallo-hydrolase [Candidatus Omnitrophica bacterium]|nr:MBL fold metallo-hydrolase [Candidatus Omnitrophota bacterium]
MARITFLGTAASVPTATRDNTSLLIRHRKFTLLIDCPGSISQKLNRTGVPFQSLRRIVITHLHPDHVYGIISLIHTQAYLNRKIILYSTPSVFALVDRLRAAFRLDRPQFPKLEYRDVRGETVSFATHGVRLEAIPNVHTPESFGVKLTCGKKSFFYSSDTAYRPELLEAAEPYRILIHECTASSTYFSRYPRLFRLHTNSAQLAGFMRSRPRLTLIPVHFLLLDGKEETRIRRELDPIPRMVFPADFDTIRI